MRALVLASTYPAGVHSVYDSISCTIRHFVPLVSDVHVGRMPSANAGGLISVVLCLISLWVVCSR